VTSVPVLIVGFKRYENIMKLLLDSHSAGVTSIYLALDGIPHGPDAERDSFLAKVDSLSQHSGINVTKWIRQYNLGPAVSIITAIDWFFAQEDYGVILEDDLVLGRSALSFFEMGLALHQNNARVSVIAGTNFWELQPGGSEWSSFPITWGWATWKDRWSELRNVFFSPSPSFSKVGKLSERFFWWVGLHRCLSGEQDAWDIPFASYFRSLNKICLFPPVNLISNIGVDVFAGNTHEKKWPLFHPISDHIQLDGSFFLEEFDQKYCLDSLILREIYGVSRRNILSGFFFSVTRRLSPSRFSRQESLSFRIKSTELP
jgi:hypothetical protein